MPILNDITEAFGNTPLVRVNRLYPESKATIAAKLEFYNPTSTVKDRLAIAMVDAAEASGQLKPGMLISDRVSLETAARILPRMSEYPGSGVTVIDRF